MPEGLWYFANFFVKQRANWGEYTKNFSANIIGLAMWAVSGIIFNKVNGRI